MFKKNRKEISIQDRIKGSLYGFLVGDALGVPVEFVSRDKLKIKPVKDMLGFGTHNQPKGTWSDDSSMILATIDSMYNNQDNFLSDKIINYNDLMDRFLNWKLKSDYTPHGKLFDIGNSTSAALSKYQNDKNNVFCGADNINSNGNGSLMRILPISLCTYFCKHESYAGTLYVDNYEVIKNISSLTHSHVLSVMSCYIYSYLINSYLMTININKAYERTREHFKLVFEGKINKDYGNIIDNKKYFNRLIYNDISTLTKEDIKSSGFVVDTLEASIWCVLTSNNYKDAVLKAVNLGDDTDTVGALTGALAGLIYGINDIPTNWLNRLQRKDYLDEMVNKYLCLLNLRKEKNKSEREQSILKYKEDLKKHRNKKATKDSWKNIPMGNNVKELDVNIILSNENMELIKLGHIPYEMEDHWFMYVDEEEKTINYYSSWTGIQAYKAYYKEENQIIIYKLIINKDEKVYRYRDKDTNTHIINRFKEHIQSEIKCHKFDT